MWSTFSFPSSKTSRQAIGLRCDRCVVYYELYRWRALSTRSRRGPPSSGLERPSAKREDARSRRGSRSRRERAPEREARGREESEGLELDGPLHLQKTDR